MNLLVNGSKSVLESFQCYYQSKLTVKYLVPGPPKEPLDLGRYHVTAPQEAYRKSEVHMFSPPEDNNDDYLTCKLFFFTFFNN